MQVITGPIEEEAVLIHEMLGTVLVIRDGLTVTPPVATRLSEVLDKVV